MNNTELKQILIKARELISNPEHWTQGAVARNRQGNRVSPLSNDAVCYCSIGALEKVAPNYRGATLARMLMKSINNKSVDAYNDSNTHPEVLAMFDKAIELC